MPLLKMGCGGCANETFEIYQERADDGFAGTTEIIVECIKCHDRSHIKPFGRLIIEWGKVSDGVLAIVPGQE